MLEHQVNMQQIQRGTMNKVQMKDVLKKLKLEGILQTYETRLYEARQGVTPHAIWHLLSHVKCVLYKTLQHQIFSFA